MFNEGSQRMNSRVTVFTHESFTFKAMVCAFVVIAPLACEISSLNISLRLSHLAIAFEKSCEHLIVTAVDKVDA